MVLGFTDPRTAPSHVAEHLNERGLRRGNVRPAWPRPLAGRTWPHAVRPRRWRTSRRASPTPRGHRVPGVPRFLYGTLPRRPARAHLRAAAEARPRGSRRRRALGCAARTGAAAEDDCGQARSSGSCRYRRSRSPRVLDDIGAVPGPGGHRGVRADPRRARQGSLALAKDAATGADWAAGCTLVTSPLPLLMLHGSDDPIVYARGTEEFASKVDPADVTVTIEEVALTALPRSHPQRAGAGSRSGRRTSSTWLGPRDVAYGAVHMRTAPSSAGGAVVVVGSGSEVAGLAATAPALLHAIGQ